MYQYGPDACSKPGHQRPCSSFGTEDWFHIEMMYVDPRGASNGRMSMSDESKKPSAEQIFMLSEEVSRIAERLARLSNGVAGEATVLPEGTSKPEIAVEVVRAALKARRLRANYFSDGLFADPAWDMMLELLIAELTDRRVTVSALSAASSVPPSTAIRWISSLVRQGLFTRRHDPLDGRRVFVELAPDTSIHLRQYFREIT